jgi:hypothetical protein
MKLNHALHILAVLLLTLSAISLCLLVVCEASIHHDPPRPIMEMEERAANRAALMPFILVPAIAASGFYLYLGVSRSLIRSRPTF